VRAGSFDGGIIEIVLHLKVITLFARWVDLDCVLFLLFAAGTFASFNRLIHVS